MKIVVILGKNSYDCSAFLSDRFHQRGFSGQQIVKIHSIDQLERLRGIHDLEIHQTPAFFTDPDFQMLDRLEQITPLLNDKEIPRSLWFDSMCMKVHDMDIRIITDHTTINPVLKSNNEFRYFGSYRIGKIDTHFVASGINVTTDKNGIPKITILSPYQRINEYERKNLDADQND